MEKPLLRFDGVYADEPKKKEIIPGKELWDEFWNDENKRIISEEIKNNIKPEEAKDDLFVRRLLDFEEAFCKKVLDSLDDFLNKNDEGSSMILWDIMGTLVEPGRGDDLLLRPSAISLFDFINKKHDKLKMGILSDNGFEDLMKELNNERGLIGIKKFINPDYVFSVANGDYQENMDYFSGGEYKARYEREGIIRKTKMAKVIEKYLGLNIIAIDDLPWAANSGRGPNVTKEAFWLRPERNRIIKDI